MKLRLGLPIKFQTKFMREGVELLSLMPTENEVVEYAECSRKLLEEARKLETLNICAQVFKSLEITPRK